RLRRETASDVRLPIGRGSARSQFAFDGSFDVASDVTGGGSNLGATNSPRSSSSGGAGREAGRL
ncbi:MAG: hypothetical protein WBC44_04920, partial [Planctomycetaceae bacterium]